jgi:hypothetical protein
MVSKLVLTSRHSSSAVNSDEYEQGKLAIDVINGGPFLRDWVDDARATPQDLGTLAIPGEQAWLNQRQGYLCY